MKFEKKTVINDFKIYDRWCGLGKAPHQLSIHNFSPLILKYSSNCYIGIIVYLALFSMISFVK